MIFSAADSVSAASSFAGTSGLLAAQASAAKARSRTTMYVSSALTGRHGLCVLLENVDNQGRSHFGLIDTGNASAPTAKAFLDAHHVKALDFLVLTHMHKDHTGNAVWILQHCNVKKVYLKQFDAAWSDGLQSSYENILRAAVLSPSVEQITGVSYALSLNADASPSASAGFISFLKKHAADKKKFQGLFTNANTALSLGNATARIYNWEIWSRDGVTQWIPGKNKRCRADRYTIDNSDNHFSLGVRVTQGNHRLWIGGDMTNLRLKKKRRAPYEGDEERIAQLVGKVDAAVLNHHGMGGSNSLPFLQALSPQYAVYTTPKADIMAGTKDSLIRNTWNILRSRLHLPETHILFAASCYKQRMEDPSVTISSTAIVSSKKDGVDMEHHNPSWNGSLTVSLHLGFTYTSYDVTGDGKADNIRIISSTSGSTHKGLKIMINQKTAWTTSLSFTDKQPVTLVRLPGKEAFLCISILSPAGGLTTKSTGTGSNNAGTKTTNSGSGKAKNSGSSSKSSTKATNSGSGSSKNSSSGNSNAKSSGSTSKDSTKSSGSGKSGTGSSASSSKKTAAKQQIFTLLRYGKKTGTGAGKTAQYGLVPAFDLFSILPAEGFQYYGTPSIRSRSGIITMTCSAKDPLCGKSSLSIDLVRSGAGLKAAASADRIPCTPSAGSSATVLLSEKTALYGSPDAAASSGTLPAGSKIHVTHVHTLRSGSVRYRIIKTDGKAAWIDMPARN